MRSTLEYQRPVGYFQLEDWINPVNGIITSSFGQRQNPVLDKEELHNGIDIAVDKGTNVVAVKGGVVTAVRVSETFGRVVEYEMDQGYKIMYAHLDDVLVEVGQTVEQGQVIAVSGNTGLTTGAHLHYTVWRDGELCDPMGFVSLPYTLEVKAEYAFRGQAMVN